MDEDPASDIAIRRKNAEEDIAAICANATLGFADIGIGAGVVRGAARLQAATWQGLTHELSDDQHLEPYTELRKLRKAYCDVPEPLRKVLHAGLRNEEMFPSMSGALASLEQGHHHVDAGLAWMLPAPTQDPENLDSRDIPDEGWETAIDLLQRHGRNLVELNETITPKVTRHKDRWSETIADTTWLPKFVREHAPDLIQQTAWYVDDGFMTVAQDKLAFAGMGSIEPYVISYPRWAGRQEDRRDRHLSGHEFLHVIADQAWIQQGGQPQSVSRQDDLYFSSPRSRQFHEALTEQMTVAMLASEYPAMPSSADGYFYADERVEVGRCLGDARTTHTMRDYLRIYFEEHLTYESASTWQAGGPYQPVQMLEEQLGFTRGTGVEPVGRRAAATQLVTDMLQRGTLRASDRL